ncbi:MAG: hypothetical protein HY673_07705 [Chloroflexi bacterium]|nr:hypothetical protein [Chloroflexota bacterium]
MDKHLNVFHAYAHGKVGDAYGEKLLEDNVTRALITTLHNSPPISKFLIEKVLGITLTGECKHTLQQKLPIPASWQKKFILCIAPDKHPPSNEATNSVERLVADKIEGFLKDKAEKERLQALLRQCVEKGEDGKPKSSHAVSDLARFLNADEAEIKGLDEPTLRYLFELTLGSRPDAAMIDEKSKFAVLVESKIHGGIVGAQIIRHIKEKFGGVYVPKYCVYPDPIPTPTAEEIVVQICTWSDIFSLCKAAPAEADAKVTFLKTQFLEYLEVNNMGEIRFTQQDFLDWEKEWKENRAKEVTGVLKERVGNLAETLAGRIGKHRVIPMNAGQNALGCNIVSDKYPKGQFKPIDVPHFSLHIQQASRGLRLYVQCEGSKPVGKILSAEHSVITGQLADAVIGLGQGFVFRVERKLFVMPGGFGKFETQWDVYWQMPLDMVRDENAPFVVEQAFQAIYAIKALPKPAKGNFFPVLVLTCHLDWQKLESLGVGLEEELMKIYEKLEPYYTVLTKYV